ncbi:titin-like [Seriola dumerili]|uniref:titin-like n=1 Tax=Seriola dumerili TaxID=41447 RepID=UPI000BBEE8DE|nr:titin-like [Seriola dumerili]
MERKVCFLLFAVGLFAMLNSAQAQTKASYSEVGGTLSLRLSPPFSGVITSILWKHDGNLVVEWVNDTLDYHCMFQGQTTLNTTTGCLEIKNMSEDYAGLYTVEINNQVQSQSYNVSVIKEVPRPDVAFKPLACSPVLDNCTLTCDGDTSEAGPVTYSWREGDGEWIPGAKDKSIKNDVETRKVKTFSCQMKNPLGVEESKPHLNPFFQRKPQTWEVIILIVFLGICGYLVWRKQGTIR